MSGEVDFVTSAELDEVTLHIAAGQAEDRARISALENTIEDLKATIQNLSTATPSIVIGDGLKETNESRAARLYEALKTAPKNCMRSREVMGLLGLQYHQQAYRVMQIAKESYKGVSIRKTGKKKTIVVLEAY